MQDPEVNPYFWIVPSDQRRVNWVLHEYVERGERESLSLRSRYLAFECQRCGKVDKYAALDSGIEPDVQMKTQDDILLSNDGFLIVSRETADLFRAWQLQNIDLVQLPGCGYAVLVPLARSVVNVEGAGLKGYERCPLCGRFRDTAGIPPLESVELPVDRRAVVALQWEFERTWYSMEWVLVSQEVRNLMERVSLRGVTFRGDRRVKHRGSGPSASITSLAKVPEERMRGTEVAPVDVQQWFRIVLGDLKARQPLTWILYREIDLGETSNFELRERYADLACPNCRRVPDEYEALKRGFDPDVVVESDEDFVQTGEGLYVASERAREAIVGQVEGVRFTRMPDRRYLLMRPQARVPVRWERAAITRHRPCRGCGRPMSTGWLPTRAALALEDVPPLTITALEYRQESWFGHRESFIVDENARDVIEEAGLTGIALLRPIM